MSDKLAVGTINIVQKSERQCFCCTWTFKENLLGYFFAPNILISPDFKIKINDGNEQTWYLRISKTGLTLVLKNYLEYSTYIDVKIECSVIVNGVQSLATKKAEHIFTNLSKSMEISDLLKDYYAVKSAKFTFNEYATADERNVDIICEITYKHVGINKLQVSNDVLSLSNDFRLLFHNEKFSDLTIVVEEQEFHVHKAILASRSPVFLAMLEGEDMDEKQENRVDIDEIDYETMKHMLLYVYTGKVEKFEFVRKLLGPADKYHLDGLKNICTEVLAETLTVENVVKTLAMADLYQVSELKKKALDFMGKHFLDVANTENFELWLKSINSELIKKF